MYPRSEYFRVDNEDFPHRYLIRFALLLTKLPLSSSNPNICDALIFYALANKSLSSENLNFSFCFGSISQFQFKMSAYSHAERGEKNSQLLLSHDHIKKGAIHTFYKQKEKFYCVEIPIHTTSYKVALTSKQYISRGRGDVPSDLEQNHREFK